MRSLTKAERGLLVLWVVAVTWTVTAFLVPDVTSGIVFLLVVMLVTFPLAMLLLLLPTVALYFTVSAPVYIWLRHRSRRTAFVVAAIVVSIPAFVIPIVANQRTAKKVSSIGQPARWDPLTIAPGQKVAYLYDYGRDFKWDTGCEDHCQRLLFSGVADRFLSGNTSALTSGSGLKQYWISRSTTQCPAERFTDAYADERDVGRDAPFPRPLLTNYLRIPSNGNKCLYEAPAALSEADVVLAQWFRPVAKPEPIWAGRFDPRLVTIDSQSGAAIYVVRAGKLKRVRKKTYASAFLLRVPLMLDAPTAFDTSTPGRWSTAGRTESGEEPEFGLSNFITNDLTVRLK